MVSKDGVIACPFCQAVDVKVFHRPSYLQAKRSHISSGGKTTFYRVPEKIEITCSCASCGKSANEIQNFFDGKKEIPHEERMKRIKDSGLPTVIQETGSRNDED